MKKGSKVPQLGARTANGSQYSILPLWSR